MPAAGSVKIGEGYILIKPEMDQAAVEQQMAKATAALAEMDKKSQEYAAQSAKLRAKWEEWVTSGLRTELEKRAALEGQSIEQRRTLNQSLMGDYVKGMESVTAADTKAEETRVKNAEQAARARERIALNTRDLEIKYGQEAADAYLTVVQEMRAAGTSMYLSRINEAKQAVAMEIRADEERVAAWRDSEAQILRSEIETKQELQRLEQDRILSTRNNLRDLANAHANAGTSIVSGWKGAAESVSKYGEALSGVGMGLTMNVVAPLGAASVALTDWGLRAADTFMSTQTALSAMGLSLRDVNSMMDSLTTFGLKTPYSVDEMLTYGTQISRALSSHNQDALHSKDPKTAAAASSQITSEAQQIIESVGNLAAYGGITDSASVSRGYYAIRKLLDTDRVNLRDTKQLEQAIGMPVEQLAQLLGLQDKKLSASDIAAYKKINPTFHGDTLTASQRLMNIMANSKTTGGVSGDWLVQNLVNYAMHTPGVKDAAANMGEMTFSSRLANMKETFQQDLRGLFMTRDPQGHDVYSGLGADIMGKRVKNSQGQMVWQGGLLNEGMSVFTDLLYGGKGTKPGQAAIPQLISGFVEGLTTIVSWVKKLADWMGSNPNVVSSLKEFAKLGAIVGPAALAVGGVTKVLGGTMKMLSPAVSGVRLAGKGIKGGFEIGTQLMAGLNAVRGQGSFLDAYRLQRTLNNKGDDRSLAQRTVDKVRGKNSQKDKLNLDITEAQAKVKEYQGELRLLKTKLSELNRTKISELPKQFVGGPGSLATSAELSLAALKTLKDKGLAPVNTAPMNQITGKVTNLEGLVTSVAGATKGAKTEVGHLNEATLKTLDDQLLKTTGLVDALIASTQGSTSEVKKLNGQSLSSLDGQIKHVTDATAAATAAVAAPGVGLKAELHELNDLDLSKVKKALDGLTGPLAGSAASATLLNHEIKAIDSETGGGGGAAHLATGGVLPGYAPGIDSIPAMLSPGEAILRPEVARALGAAQINHWNGLAMRGQLQHYAAGTAEVGGKGSPIQLIWDTLKEFDLRKVIEAFSTTVAFDASSAGVGGRTGKDLVSWGSRKGGEATGRAAFAKANGLFKWVEDTLPFALRKVPSGWGTLAGIIGGLVAPTAGELFKKDVWFGSGNILAREGAFTLDLLNPKSIWKMIKDGGKGLWDTITSTIGTAVDFASDPIGFIQKSIGQLQSMVQGIMGSVTSMISGVQTLISEPGKYASEAGHWFWNTAKAAMPNTTGLFDFSNWGRFAAGGVLPGYAPGIDSIPAMLSPGEAVLRPEVARALGAGQINAWNSAAMRGQVVHHAAGTAGGAPTDGISIGALKSMAGLEAAIKKVYEIITKAFTTRMIGSGTESHLNDWLDKENKGLQKLVNERVTLAGKLKTAQANLKSIQSQEASMASNISQTAQGTATLSGIFNSGGVSVANLDAGLKAKVANIKKFAADITRLQKMGFSKEIISQIAQDGPDTGGAEAEALLSATKGQVKSINSSYGQISSSSDALGQTVSKAYYGAGEAAAQGLVNGLQAQDKKLQQQIEKMAQSMIKTLERALHFGSDTHVNSSLGTLLDWLTGRAQNVSRKPLKKPKVHHPRHHRRHHKVTGPIGGYWTGTLSASPGLAMVGEHGPELVDFGGGERVYNAHDTAAMRGRKYEIHVHEAKSENTTQSVLRGMKYAEVMYGF